MRRLHRAPTETARPRPRHSGHRHRPPEQPGRHRRPPSTVGQGVRHLQHRDGPRTLNTGDAEHRGEHVQQPRPAAQVQLLVGKTGHSYQATGPGAVGQVVVDHLFGGHRRGHPLRICQRASVVDAHSQGGTGRGPAEQLGGGPVQVGGFAVEGVEQELVAGDFGRHPVELGIDGRHSPPRHDASHGVNRVSRRMPAPVRRPSRAVLAAGNGRHGR